MKTLPDTVLDYSIIAAESFVQTAVFVDDRIYSTQPKAAEAPKIVSLPRTRRKASKSAERSNAQAGDMRSEAEEEETSPDTYEIVNHFAKKQIVCSLYQPKEGAKVSKSSDIFPLCKAADIVVIDWDLYGDKGQKAKELADGLIKQAVEDVPEQLRLILIYTQELNLQAVANELYEKVHANIGDDFRPVDDEGGLVFHTVNSRVVVLGKPGRTRPEEYGKFVVGEKELADVAIKEFAKLASGVLHAAALLGLAEIRKNSRKILSKFNRDLDPAFLAHLAMCLPEEDASSHVVPLLVSEIEAVLEDALPSPLISEKILKNWCQVVWEPGAHLREVFGQDADLRAIGEAVLTMGFEAAKEQYNNLTKPNNNKNTRKASKMFLEEPESLENHEFAHLMSSRTFYDQEKRSLKLGVIVRRRRDSVYLLCLQPICDSVRLKGATTFLFAEFTDDENLRSGRATHVVIAADGTPHELYFQPKSFQCTSVRFKPSPGSDAVATKKTRDGCSAFYDASNRRYDWVDQLKPAHAQRAIAHLASDLSRVGLTESEWLRLLERK